MSRKVNTGQNPFAFERIARMRHDSESNRRFQEVLEFISQQPAGPVEGLRFSFRADATPETHELLEDNLGHPTRMSLRTGFESASDDPELTEWRADILAEWIEDHAEGPHYRLHISRVVVGDEMLDWEMQEIGKEVALHEMRSHTPTFYFLLVAVKGKTVEVLCLRSLVATPDQLSMGVKVWAEKGGKIDMGHLHLAWRATVDPYSRTIVSSYIDGVDEPPTDVAY